ncbi:sacsin-like [Saccostrea echinata]|uniref:sacsin-like n=1 Tax=Saccostrea echinata TaxID=191078 RepID=UPI002A7F2B59|nr:sacsin-like [Saccostrea echinata]
MMDSDNEDNTNICTPDSCNRTLFNQDVDSDYEGICEPPILRQLKNILDQYPDGSQIIRELVQNAEDAGATTFKIYYAEGDHNPTPGANTPVYQEYFRTPALCVYNDGVFSQDDWKGIKSIYTSVKEKDALKVGRFGLGFKSIFHITDSPVIISGDQLLIINPLKLPHKVCHRIPFKKLTTNKYKIAWSLMKKTLGLEGEGLFELNESAIQKQNYPRTLFWFPLRQNISELSNKIYTSQKMTELFESFEEEAETILLFLKSVSNVSIYDTRFRKKFAVQMKGVGNVNITKDREYIKNQVIKNKIPEQSLWSEYRAILTTQRPQNHQETKQEWFVVNLFQGEKDMSQRMLELAHDEQLGYAPYAGIAFPLTQGENEHFKGHVFCFLPLPIEPDSRSLTNLPVHVNGFFALTSNRRHMLWATQDQHETDDNRLVWNKLMISELLSSVYTKLLKSLLQDPTIAPETIYHCLPDAKNVDPKWSILLRPVYTEVFGLRMFFKEEGETLNRKKLHFKESRFFIFDSKEKLFKGTLEALRNLLTIYTDNLVCLPEHLQFAVCNKEFFPKGVKARTINAEFICHLLRENETYKTFTRSLKLEILHYILANTTVDQIEDVELLPTDDPSTFVSFKDETVYICLKGEEKMFPLTEKQLLSSIPDDVKDCILELAKSGQHGVKVFSSSDFKILLQKSTEKQNIPKDIPPSERQQISDWISKVWKYISVQENDEDLMDSICHLSILPEAREEESLSLIRLHRLKGLYMVRRQGSSILPDSICELLRSLNVTILHALPKCFPSAAIKKYIFGPTENGVCEILAKMMTLSTCLSDLVDKFEEISENNRRDFAVFISKADNLTSSVDMLLKKVKMFPATSGKKKIFLTSVLGINKMTPQNYTDFPVEFPYPLITGDFNGAQLALRLGVCRQTEENLTTDILKKIQNNGYNEKDIDVFMIYFLKKIQMNNVSSEQIEIAASIPFVLSTDGKRRLPRELFEVTDKTQDLFQGETDKFPHLDFSEYSNGLKKLGLKSSKDVSISDLMQTLDHLINKDRMSLIQAEIKVRAFERYVNSLLKGETSSLEEKELLQKMKYSCWMPKMTIKPKHYPQLMPWYSASIEVGIPSDMYSQNHEMLVGSVAMLNESTLEPHILDELLYGNPSTDIVLKQLLLLTGKYEKIPNPSEFGQMLTEIYQFIAKASISGSCLVMCKEKNIIWTEKNFSKPRQVYVNFLNGISGITLEPYMYQLPQIYSENDILKTFFLKVGCKADLEIDDLITILETIKTRQQTSDLVDSKHDLLIVEGILNIMEDLNQNDCLSTHDKERILFPVQSQGKLFQLLPLADCTYVDYKREDEEDEEDEEDLKFVHPKIRSSIAANLGVSSLTRRIVESKGVEDIPWGQKEELTDRLKNLIADYADGTSVLKEMLQNADDAGASCLRVLYDERTNENSRVGLIDKGMAECQGPAIWVYNDAKFEEKDFQNIIRLGAGTKESDMTKIGKFGLGFCSVYNITDMPSIISGESLVILDPRTIHLGKALKNNNPGLRFKVSDPKTRHRLRHQLRPFNGVFGCDCQIEGDSMSYEGTLFRLPLRTAKQADETKNQISSKHYTKQKVIQLIEKFIEDAGNLMLFIQNVNTVEFFHWASEAREECRFYRIQRISKNPVAVTHANILKEANKALLTQNKKPIQRKENITIKINILRNKLVKKILTEENLKEKTLEMDWSISWQIGSHCQHLSESTDKNIIVGSAAIPDNHCLLLDRTEKKSTDIPLGFYKTGHVFCFLPLPQESMMPVHINGYFAVETSRRRLTVSLSDNVYSEGTEWNKFLLRNTICYAYLNLLESLSGRDSQKYHENWPLFGKDEMMNELVISFYEKVVRSEHKLFYQKKTSGDIKKFYFGECIFLDPSLRYDFGEKIGEKSFGCFLTFNDQDKIVMDMPVDIYKQFQKSSDCQTKLKENICNAITFYLKSFIPSLLTNWWSDSVKERNKLLLHILQIDDMKVRERLKETPCVPTKPHGKLRKPKELVYPYSDSSKFCVSWLFSVDDGRFPVEEFTQSKIVQKLKELGMITDTLPNELVIDRAKSVQRLSSKPEKMRERCQNVLRYIELKKDSLNDVQNALQSIKFLPVLRKPAPSEWPFKWYSSESKRLEAGKELFLSNCRCVVGCVRPVIDEENFFHALKYLGVRYFSDVDEKIVIEQFKEITANVPADLSDSVWQVFDEVYRYFNSRKCRLLTNFTDKPCILTKSTGLIKPELCAVDLQSDLKPFLYKIEERWTKYRAFLYSVGVKQMFSVECLVQTLIKMKTKEGEHSNYVPTVVRLLNMLSESKRRIEFQASCDLEKILLPDEEGIMRKSKDLCIDDNKCRIAKDNKIIFAHGDLNVSTTSLFEIKSKSAQFLRRFAGAVSFGQSEKLVTRLKGILKDYPCDVSILNELLQNADDAGATEIHFIHDKRTHPKDSLFDKSLEDTQGPSLVVFNNSCFSKTDIEGISKLGEGSKGSDPMTTGQFGIGFNAVYHITDVPSFLTKGNAVPSGEALVMFDPHCKYVPLATHQNPGMMLDNIQSIKFKETFPDMYQTYLTEEVPASTGTWFRFPLRTQKMANVSQIKKGKAMTNSDLENLFSSLKNEMPKSLMFLSNVAKITLSVISFDGKLQQISSVSAIRSRTDHDKLQQFNNHAKQYMESLQTGRVSLAQNEGLSVQYQLELDISCDENYQELWCVSQVCDVKVQNGVDQRLINGFKDGNISLSPRTGVAYKIAKEQDRDLSQVFDFLPLPIQSNLPVHINGHFAVDASRTNIWVDTVKGKSLKGLWNDFLLEHALPFAFVELVCFLREHLFKDNGASVLETVDVYNNAFPILSDVANTKWEGIVRGFYQFAWEKKVELFPIYLPSALFNSFRETRHFFTKNTKSDVTGGCISFVSLNNDNHSFSTYFVPPNTNECSTTVQTAPDYLSNCQMQQNAEAFWFDTELSNILKLLGMKILESPAHIAETVQQSLKSNSSAPFLNVAEIVKFLKSWNTAAVDKCRITTVGISLKKTLFQNISFVQKLAHVCFGLVKYNHIKQLEGIPLCVQNDNILQVFSKDRKKIVSQYCDLLPNSSQKFLHVELVNIFKSQLTEAKDCLLQLDLETFTKLLEENESRRLLSEIPVPLSEKHQSKKWFIRFWEFLSSLPRKNILEDCTKHLGSWCLIPAATKSSKRVILFPFKLRHAVLDTDSFQFGKDQEIGRILLKLEIPSPCKDYIGDTFELRQFMQRVCASLLSVENVLTCLVHHKGRYEMLPKDAVHLVMFLYHKLHDDFSSLKSKFKEINFYESFDGSLTNLITNGEMMSLEQDCVPKEGLRSLCKHKGLKILKKNYRVYEIYREFSVKEINPVSFYEQYFLRYPQLFDHETRMIHIKYIKEKHLFIDGGERMQSLIKEFPFVQNTETRELQRVCEFFTPFLRLCRQMCNKSELLPLDPFYNEEWKDFLIYAGLKTQIPVNVLLRFAREIDERQSHRKDESLMSHSKLLLAEILNVPNLHKEQRFLRELRKIKFLIPTKVEKEYSQIVGQFKTGHSLISFENAVYPESKIITWSSCKILPDLKCKDRTHWSKVEELLLIKNIPDLNDVISHVHKVCHALKRKEKDKHENQESTLDLSTFIGNIYSKLKDFASNNIVELKTGFCETPLIYNIEHNCWLRLDQVILQLIRKEEIPPYLCRGSEIFGAHFNFFRNLGVADEACVYHYARVFDLLHSSVGNRPLFPEELLVCQKSMVGFLSSLEKLQKTSIPEESKYDKLLEFPCIYLPSSENTLEKSSSLTLCDRPDFVKRIRNFNLIKFVKSVELEKYDEKRLLSCLPSCFRPILLSQQVKEIIHSVDKCGSCERLETLKRKFQMTEFVNGVCAILSKSVGVTESMIKQYKENLLRLHFQQVSQLETKLLYRKEEVQIAGSVRSKAVFFDTDEAVVFIKVDQGLHSAWRYIRDPLFHVIIRCTDGCAIHYREQILRLMESESAEEMRGLLSKLEVSIETSWEPELGSYVPEDLHDYLDNSIREFRDGEIVAFEVLNPSLDGVEDYVFIYVRIIKKIDNHKFSMYNINDGSDIRCEIAFRLYRFIQSEGNNTSQEIERHTDLQGEIYQMRKVAIFEEIKWTLIEAWKYNPNDFKRVRNRLLMNWHPDKHPDNHLAKDVTQYILEIERRLKNGEFKEFIGNSSDDRRNYYYRQRKGRGGSFYYGERQSTFSQPQKKDYDDWIDGYMSRRRRRRRGNWTSWSSSSSGCVQKRTPNPQPQVGKLWFKQAKYDLIAALKQKERCIDDDTIAHTLNWICYKCHQAIEKCIKSLMYREDANKAGDNLRTHDLVSLSHRVSVPGLTDLCRQFGSEVSSSPDSIMYPLFNTVPGEVFTSDQAVKACSIAESIVEMCDEQWNS